MTREYNWTLREDRPDYFSSKVYGPIMTLNLRIRRSGGQEDPVGRFRFDLEDLADRGLVNRHQEDGRTRYVVQINHIGGREYNLGVRAGETADLAPFAVR